MKQKIRSLLPVLLVSVVLAACATTAKQATTAGKQIPGKEAAQPALAHATRIPAYEGTKTCTVCHRRAAKEVANSLHYQQQAVPQFLKEWEAGKTAGMMVSF